MRCGMIIYLFIKLFTYSGILFSIRLSNYMQEIHVWIIYRFVFAICLYTILLKIA